MSNNGEVEYDRSFYFFTRKVQEKYARLRIIRGHLRSFQTDDMYLQNCMAIQKTFEDKVKNLENGFLRGWKRRAI